jgi:transcriptional regulator with XRE-family HTH domain
MPKRKQSIGTLEQVIGRNVRAVREDRKLSQTTLGNRVAEWLGGSIPKQIVSKVEKGERSLDLTELVTFAHVLGVAVVDLLTPEGDPEHEVTVGADNWTPTITELRDIVMGHELAVTDQRERDEVIKAVSEALERSSRLVTAKATGRIRLRSRATGRAVDRKGTQ